MNESLHISEDLHIAIVRLLGEALTFYDRYDSKQENPNMSEGYALILMVMRAKDFYDTYDSKTCKRLTPLELAALEYAKARKAYDLAREGKNPLV